jgi:outer membrane protein TolC
MRRAASLVASLLFLAYASFLHAADGAKILTFAEALTAAEASHPELILIEAEREAAAADELAAGARRDFSVNAEGILRSGRQTAADGGFASDNSLRLVGRKPLYDFGRTDAAEAAAKSETAARDANLLDARAAHRLEVMADFFDVLLADLQYSTDNEYMAVAYVNFDNAQDRFKLGQAAAADVAELEYHYQEKLVKRNASQQLQRTSRARLANAINRPGQLPGELEDPPLPGNNRVLPEYQVLLPLMLDNNPRLVAQSRLLAAAQQRLEGMRAENRPTLDAEVEAADYSRPATTRDRVRAGVVLNWPLYQGDRVNARIAREQAQFHKLQAGYDKLKMGLSQALLENWLEIEQLQKTVRGAAKKQTAFRDLALERSRAVYELELKTNLGDSMAATVEAKLRERHTEYQLALAFARLEALLGKPLEAK